MSVEEDLPSAVSKKPVIKKSPHEQPLAEHRIIDSQTLLDGQPWLLIRHMDTIYRLQTTRQGKLILTK